MGNNSYQKEAKEITEKLLDLIGIKSDVSVVEEEEKSLKIIIDSKEESGLLIGAHGLTLQAIQSFIALALRKKADEWIRITLDIGQWRSKQKEGLVSLGISAASRAKSTGEPQYLYNLSSAQRREIHIALSEDKEIETESQGEGEERVLIIKKK